jgi:hypothetical protein
MEAGVDMVMAVPSVVHYLREQISTTEMELVIPCQYARGGRKFAFPLVLAFQELLWDAQA